jgi:hypothetical protein
MADSECLVTIIQRLQAKTKAIQEKMVVNQEMTKAKVDTAVSTGWEAMDKKIWRSFRKEWVPRWTVISVGREEMKAYEKKRGLSRGVQGQN